MKTKYFFRDDKYGQNYKVVCSCGLSSNWHTTKENAKYRLYQEHQYNNGCMMPSKLCFNEVE